MSNLKAAREKAGLTQEALADLAGTTQPQVRRLEIGERKLTREWAERLAPHLGTTPEQLVFGPSSETSPQPGALHYRPPPRILGDRDFPIYAATEGGPGAMVVTNDVLEMVQRPWYMRDVGDGFGVFVVGESMDPAFRPGDIAVVNPKLPMMRGKNAIFVSGEDRGEFHATIKEYQKQDTRHWHVLQHNPPEGGDKHFTLEKKTWTKALRVVGKYEG